MKELNKNQLRQELKRIINTKDTKTTIKVINWSDDLKDVEVNTFQLIEEEDGFYFEGYDADGRPFDVAESAYTHEVSLTEIWHQIAGDYIGKFLIAFTTYNEINPEMLTDLWQRKWWF
jgi:hypothetical protein